MVYIGKLILLFCGLIAAPGLSQQVFAQYQINVTKLSETLYIYESYFSYQGNKTGANAILYAGQDSVVIIDTPWDEDQTQQLLDWVEAELKKPVAYFIITHAHQDRIGGISVLKTRGITSFSSEKTAEEAIKRGYEAPDKLFRTDSVFSLENKKIEVFYPGAGHTVDNVIVYFPEAKLLYGGCFLKSSEAVNLGNLEDADVKQWPESLKKVEQRFPQREMVIPGHGSWNKGAIETTGRLLKEYLSK